MANLLQTLKLIDKHFDEMFKPISHVHYEKGVLGENSCMTVKFNHGFITSNDPYTIRLEWFPNQDRYSMLMDLYSDTEFTINTWDMRRITTWNEDFIINFDIERGYFDCLNTVYPLTTNFKFESLPVLKSISQKYVEKKKIHGIK